MIKSLLFLVFATLLFSFQGHKKNKVECVLKAKKTVFRQGEVPELEVHLINRGKKSIYLIGSLDGSEKKWRMPYCYFTIEKPMPDTPQFLTCKTLNPLRKDDFVKVGPGENFDPYMQVDNYGFFRSHELTQQETFRNPGIYRITFHYSTLSDNLNEYIGPSPGNWSERSDTALQKKLFSKVPRLDLASNTVEIRISRE
jgi:hypothetical protein